MKEKAKIVRRNTREGVENKRCQARNGTSRTRDNSMGQGRKVIIAGVTRKPAVIIKTLRAGVLPSRSSLNRVRPGPVFSKKKRSGKSGKISGNSRRAMISKVIIKTVRAQAGPGKEGLPGDQIKGHLSEKCLGPSLAEKAGSGRPWQEISVPPGNERETGKKQPDRWSDCGQIFFTGGKAYAVTEDLRTVCLGDQSRVTEFFCSGVLDEGLAPLQKETLWRLRKSKKDS